ncbi:MBL fold metallo-hydrolase [Syntrophobacter fumaroxidans]|uniref:Putative metal-dependent hydrolase n=1 Tax=Syntrophobacter fumaroxidans (strain DSM 10017 / MPOB) TaxID=335543 RepID=A0LQ87_SYNFM|nr:MBL fold metallo-hydrolase [Syntrophobacter fumaroxidans]ABK19589.1 putative metal-dependent hydrolase [Syntrophobacter fumaroxidans MPOB]
MTKALTLVLFLVVAVFPDAGAQQVESDRFETAAGPLSVQFLGHGSLAFQFADKVIYVDPYSEVAEYSKLPKADIVFITHEHKDHFDPKALGHIVTDKTLVVLTETCGRQYQEGLVMHNGDLKTIQGITVEAVPAYNIVHLRPSGFPYHAKSFGNGYVFTFGEKRVYVAGDTENIPEMKDLKNIDIAFLPMNLPYTMTPEMVADAARIIRPRILYPYHYGETDVTQLIGLLKDEKSIEVRIRNLK